MKNIKSVVLCVAVAAAGSMLADESPVIGSGGGTGQVGSGCCMVQGTDSGLIGSIGGRQDGTGFLGGGTASLDDGGLLNGGGRTGQGGSGGRTGDGGTVSTLEEAPILGSGGRTGQSGSGGRVETTDESPILGSGGRTGQGGSGGKDGGGAMGSGTLAEYVDENGGRFFLVSFDDGSWFMLGMQ
jgi:hypothetical protein